MRLASAAGAAGAMAAAASRAGRGVLGYDGAATSLHAVVEFGFTERQARFLALVMRHAGVCVPRQYARSPASPTGAKCNAFFDKLVRRGYARGHTTACTIAHGSTTCTHTAAVSRHRRAREPLSSPGVAARRDRAADAAGRGVTHVFSSGQLCGERPPTSPIGGTVALRRSKRRSAEPDHPQGNCRVPIGVESDGRTSSCTLPRRRGRMGFVAFFGSRVAAPRVAPSVDAADRVSRPVDHVYDDYQRSSTRNWSRTLSASRPLRELQWYFETRRQPPYRHSDRRRRDIFRAWVRSGSIRPGSMRGTCGAGSSTATCLRRPFVTGLAAGAGAPVPRTCEWPVYTATYRHLSPWWASRGVAGAEVEKGVEKGATRGDISPHGTLNPVLHPRGRHAMHRW